MKKTETSGFTLIEMMIVTEIVCILMAIAVPAMLRQRIETNEAATVANLKAITTAQISYCTGQLTYGNFEQLTNEDLGKGTSFLDPSWHEGVTKAGYVYTMDTVEMDVFICTATPAKPDKSGINTWHADEGGQIWWE